MKIEKSERNFRFLVHPKYAPDGTEARLASESSAVGDYEDAVDIPGSSALWIGDNHHLNREEVLEFVSYLLYWLKHQRLPQEKEDVK